MATYRRCQVFAGCYERTVFGYDLLENDGEDDDSRFTLRASFTSNNHTGCIKSLAVSAGGFLASGSTDELIQLYDLREKAELGSLMQHDGSITSLGFHDDGHMISGGEDGVICIWGTETWDCMKIMKGHKGDVHSVSVHPSGKLALSVGRDKTLRTWNLLKGRPAYTTNIKKVADIVLWSPDGQLYAVVTGRTVDIYDITTATVCCSYEHEHKILCACFVADRKVAVGGEGMAINLLQVNKKKTAISSVLEFKAHENRIKALQCVCVSGSGPEASGPAGRERWLVSASSDGCLRVWGLDAQTPKETPSLLAEVNTKARLTCLAVREETTAKESKETTTQQAAKRPLVSAADDVPGKKRKRKGKP